MKISVITACYNSALTLQATIDSFHSQTWPDKELIIIDGGSTDGSIEIISSSGIKVNKWISETDSGIYDALNKGIGMADGDVIGFLHSGDFFSGTRVLENIGICFSKEESDVVYGDLKYVHSGNRERLIRYWKSGCFYPENLHKGWMPPHPTFYMKKKIYSETGLFDTSMKIAADYDLMLRVLLRPSLKVSYIPEVFVEMGTGGISNGNIPNIIRKSKEDLISMRKNGLRNIYWVLLRKNLSKIKQFSGE